MDNVRILLLESNKRQNSDHESFEFFRYKQAFWRAYVPRKYKCLVRYSKRRQIVLGLLGLPKMFGKLSPIFPEVTEDSIRRISQISEDYLLWQFVIDFANSN